MADVFFGYVYDFGPEEEWIARRDKGAWLDKRRLPVDAGERRGSDGRLELLGIESADPRWIREAADRLAEQAYRLRALGTMASTLCQVAAARLDGMVTLRRCRAVDVAAAQLIVREAGGLVAFPLVRGRAQRAARPRAPFALRGRADGARAGGAVTNPTSRGKPLDTAATLDGVIDWKLATTVAEGIANLKPAPEASAFEHVAGPAEESARLVSAYTGLMADSLPHAEPVDRPLWIQGNVNSLKKVLDPVADKLGQGMGPLSGAVSAASRRAAGGRGRRGVGDARPARARPVRVPDPRSRGARAAAVRLPQPRRGGVGARRRARRAAALGRAPRGHARAAVRRRAVAAAAHRLDGAGAAGRPPGRPGAADEAARHVRLPLDRRQDPRGRPRHADRGPGAPRRARRHAGVHGGAGGLRRARDGRGRRRDPPEPAGAARRAWTAAAATARASCGSSRS